MTATSCPAEKTDLGRKLCLGAVLALGIGTTVGSGIFSSLYLEDGGQYVYFREAGPPCYYMWEKQNRKAA